MDESELTEEYFEEEPFGVFEAFLEAYEIDGYRDVIRQKHRRQERESKALFWLARKMRIEPYHLAMCLESIRRNEPLYEVSYRLKEDGSIRKICAPSRLLKIIQRRINKNILSEFSPAPNVFGFSGGSILDAIIPLFRGKTILCVDLKKAFPTITSDDVFNCLTTDRAVYTTGWGPATRIESIEYGWFSWTSAKILAELTTYQEELPQGAPTSPRLFDLVCHNLDKGLLKLAEKVGGVYTRYADNIFFSTKQEEFPRPVRQAIIKLIEGRLGLASLHRRHRRSTLNFNWHKLRIMKVDGRPQRMLGLNIIGNKIHNTRDFKRRLRLTIHHIRWLLDHGMRDTEEFKTAQRKLRGQMAFARIDTLPQKLLDSYRALEERLN